LIASAGFELLPTPTCLGLKGFVVVVVSKILLKLIGFEINFFIFFKQP